MQNELKKMLGAQSPLARAWPNYEPRPGQLRMALEVARAFVEDDFSLIEAGTGTGKTLAYLLPALMSGKKTIVSTGLKNLQDQIFEKDLPFIREFFGDNFKAARLKGRENYLCLHFLKKSLAQMPIFPGADDELLNEIAAFAPQTKHGDRAEFTFLEEGSRLWAELSAPADRCLGQKCPDFSGCYLWRARREAAAADLVLVNHHLFMADLAVKAGGFGEVLPEWEAAVFDEAHLLEEAATSYFGKNISGWALNILKRDLEKLARQPDFSSDKTLAQAALIFGRQADAFSASFYRNEGERELWQDDDPEAGPFRDFLLNFHHDAAALVNRFKNTNNDEAAPIIKRLSETAAALAFIAAGSDREYVYQVERTGRRLSVSALPIRVAKHLADGFINSGRTLVFTSATLSSGGDFSYFKERLGLWPELTGLAIESPFDYRGRTMAYLPTHLPLPADSRFIEAAAREMEALINLSRGRALILFTSYKNMNFAAEFLRLRVQWPILVQGQRGRSATLAEFKAKTSSVLLATHSFWQGVDVPGESLSSVIIEKLPFPRPDRPLVKARSQLMEDGGRDAFMEYYIPEAALTLKQGLGRLMRSQSDRGLLAILDVRLMKKGYGKKILKTLPPSRITGDIGEVAEFLRGI